jgi:hypothetical protein
MNQVVFLFGSQEIISSAINVCNITVINRFEKVLPLKLSIGSAISGKTGKQIRACSQRRMILAHADVNAFHIILDQNLLASRLCSNSQDSVWILTFLCSR